MNDCNIANALSIVAATQGERIALAAKDGREWRQWTFAQLQALSTGLAALLQKKGIRTGDRVMLMVRPSVEFICLTFALFRIGAVVILIDPGMGYRNLLRCISSVRPDILVGIPKAVLFSRLFRQPFQTLRARIKADKHLLAVAQERREDDPGLEQRNFQAQSSDLAAIIFTTGSTGPPKGVQYTHGIFAAQLALIRDYFGIGPDDVDQPGFPLFGLFATALGAKAVIPDMDPTRPAQVDPEKFVRTLLEHKVTYSFGSPAIWRVVSAYCLERRIVLPLRQVLMAGAPVSGALIEQVRRILPPSSRVFTPYGATESLPVACIEGEEVMNQTWALTQTGKGTCVGRPLPGMDIRIIAPVEGPVSSWTDVCELPVGSIGEIVVRGPVVTKAYDGNARETELAKIADGKQFWHRMGDMGYLDDQRRLWFCGRKAHRVITEKEVMYTIPCEALFNQHPAVLRSALVGVGCPGKQIPVIVVELRQRLRQKTQFFQELRQIASGSLHAHAITLFLIHKGFPVDIRHNAKIFREQLAVWAARRLQLKPG